MTTQTFLLPDLGEGLTEAEVVRWLVAVGDVVAVDAPVAEVETAKSVVEVPSPYAGVVAELHGDAGTMIDVGKPLITIGILAPAAETYREEEKAGSGNVLIGYGTPEGEANGRRRRRKTFAPDGVAIRPADARDAAAPASAAAAAAPASTAAAAAPASTAEVAAPAGTAVAGDGRSADRGVRVPLVISPLVRRLARDAQVDLRAVHGSGAGGVITRKDVDAVIAAGRQVEAVASPVVAAVPAERTGLAELRRVGMSGFRKAVAATLSRSRAEIPEATTWVDVDATALVELRESLRTATDAGPGLLALMARFVVAGLQKYPELNGFVDTEREELVQYSNDVPRHRSMWRR